MDESMLTDPQYLDDETTCAICYAEFLDTEDLNIHITQLHLNETSVKRFCNLCHSIYPDIEDYVIHLKDYHIKSLKWCKYCTRVFFNNHDLEQHEVKHGEMLVKTCSQCTQSFLNYEELEAHEYSSHKDHVLSEGIMLQECFPLFSSVLHMNVRTFFSVPYTLEMYSCVCCDFMTSDIDIYTQHLKMDDQNLFVCDLCCNVFKEKDKLIKHIEGSCEDDDVYATEHIKPEEINRLFRKDTKQSLNPKCDSSNFEVSKRTIPLLTCNFCFRQFVGNVALTKHIDRTHKASFHLYKYKCILCEQVFNHPKILFTHYYSKHKDLKPYTCKICDKKFKVRKAFTLHIKLDHKSVGFVEFDENYHVFFSDKKSENPFQPQSLITESNANKGKEPSEIVSDLKETDKIDLTNVNSDFMNPTETECDTDIEKKQKKLSLKPKRSKRVLTKQVKKTKSNHETEVSSNDSDAPLITITRKTASRTNKTHPSKKFVCIKCDKNCYTFQNYHHHMSLHAGCKLKSCIKCGKKFKSKDALEQHIDRKHTSSKLTETLKQLLERRKNPNNLPKDRQSISEGFRRSIRQVNVIECNYSPAEIKLLDNSLSAKKFIESFIPEESSKDIKITNSITLRTVFDNTYKPHKIIMTKFTPEPTVVNRKLRMPVKFKPENTDNVKASIKLVQELTSISKPCLAFTSKAHVDHPYSDSYENKYITEDREEIPDVAEEVMLNEDDRGGGVEWEESKSIETHNSIIIPNLPENYGDVRIGHLQSQAPYYKIVKMQDILKTTEMPTKTVPVKATPKNVTLPDGTKLVTVNPLAHLLGNMNVEELLKSNKKQYEPKIKDIKTAMEKAMKTVYKPRRQRQNIC